MIDNKATKRLRAMLDERGIHWWTGESEDQTRWENRGLTWEFEEGVGLAFLGVCENAFFGVYENDVTPEQAIAATLRKYTYEQWRAINEIVGNAMEYAHDVAIMHPDKADPCWDLSNYVDQILEVAFGKHKHEKRSCAACPEMDNPDSYIFHLMCALEYERGCCRDCKHSHMTVDGKHCKWCSVLATHKIDDKGCCDPSNGYDPEPYFDAGFHCGFFERRVSE